MLDGTSRRLTYEGMAGFSSDIHKWKTTPELFSHVRDANPVKLDTVVFDTCLLKTYSMFPVLRTIQLKAYRTELFQSEL